MGFIALLLPPPARTGRPRADDRRTVEDILYILITGRRWQDLPHEYGAPTTVWRRLKWWGEEQV
jgi:transposase